MQAVCEISAPTFGRINNSVKHTSSHPYKATQLIGLRDLMREHLDRSDKVVIDGISLKVEARLFDDGS